MPGERSRYGLLVSALGAIVLAVSVFLPWYGVSFTAAGIAGVEQVGDHLVAEYGNANLQGDLSAFHGSLAGLAGQQVTALSAHQVLRDMNVILLVLAGLALLDALFPLARAASAVPNGAGGSVVLLGGIAAICVIARIVDPPTPAGGGISLSIREGAWLALLGALTMVIGGLWPRAAAAGERSEDHIRGAWRGLSGWTPGS
jgi:hypothetical protein